MKSQIVSTIACALIVWIGPQASAASPLKVFILAGQSNMQGHAQVRTLEHLGMDPQTAPLLKMLRSADGTPIVCQHVWISSIGHDGSEQERHGQLTVGYGAAGRDVKIGPELMFGVTMQQLVGEPILIIKTAWGGKSLHTDFRPPSAGPYKFNEKQLAQLESQGKDIKQEVAARTEASGKYYRLMTDHVRTVLSDLKRVCPDYDVDAGYELAGFVWFQGWNDMVDQGVYPQRDQIGGYGDYSTLLAQFIRDVRRDLDTPNLPFVIGVMGVGGPTSEYDASQQRYKAIHQNFRDAMAAPASLVEFQGNVAAVFTEKCWDLQLGELSQRWGKVQSKTRELNQDKSLSAQEREAQLANYRAEHFTPEELRIYEVGKSNAEFHYLGSGKIMVQIGKAFAETLAAMHK
ncbi:MAG: sialate O-acetylesterase [Pirellulaceae bacterium]|nr:hypothetical protein [Planctomycetales bacterium]